LYSRQEIIAYWAQDVRKSRCPVLLLLLSAKQ